MLTDCAYCGTHLTSLHMARTRWTTFRSGIWPTLATNTDDDDDDDDYHTHTRGFAESKPRYHSLAIRTSRHRPFRLRPRVAQRLACVILVLVGLHFWLLHSAYCEALSEKYSPTLFTRLSRHDEDLLASARWHLSAEDQHAERRYLLQNRSHWKSLGSGYEGDTFTYNGSVIKVFRPGRSPLRNCVPDVLPMIQWPPEIPVSLLLGGFRHQQDHVSTGSAQSGFLPVLDYFLIPTSGETHPGEWYLVTPFLKSGTLEHLARRLQHDDHSLGPEEVDARFRPSFNRLLRALDLMHTEYDLCHDDIKMDNIFVTTQMASAETTVNKSSRPAHEEDATWLIADLGNARQPSHSYHSSLLWVHDNGQHPDCRVNDVVRLVKSYMLFLQSASSPRRDTFNKPFLTASAPWSQLYWFTINTALQALDGSTAAHTIFEVSSNAFPPSTITGKELKSQYGAESTYKRTQNNGIHSLARPILEVPWSERLWQDKGDSARRAFMVRRELHSGMSVSEKWAKIFGTMGILPTPHVLC